jgi:hypothetical protein
MDKEGRGRDEQVRSTSHLILYNYGTIKCKTDDVR